MSAAKSTESVVEKAKEMVSNVGDGIKRYLNIENTTEVVINNGGPGFVVPPGGGSPQYVPETEMKVIKLPKGDIYATSDPVEIQKIEKNQYFGVGIIPVDKRGKPLVRDYGEKVKARIAGFKHIPDESGK